MSRLVSSLLSNISSEEEVVTLQQLHTRLLEPRKDVSTVVKHQETALTINHNGTEDAFTENTPEGMCEDQGELNRLTCYVFDRRFGWSEPDTDDSRRYRRLSCSGSSMAADCSKQKTAINTLLDELIKWYMHQELSLPVLQALKHTIKQAMNLPVVRNRAVIHTMDWCKSQTDQLCEDSFHTILQEVIVLALTDVWSAIRNACASRLGFLAAHMDTGQVQRLFDALVKLCCDAESSWQTKEGAIMGINAILTRYLNKTHTKSPMSSPRTLDTELQEPSVPEFVCEQIHNVVFSLLSHSQLTIREHAAKTMATYITCSSITDALTTLKEVVQILTEAKYSSNNDLTQSPHKFLDDYASEGFLGVCIFLVKVIPLSHLLPGWPRYISTFLKYISHPASTVRQAASSVFKYLVVKSSHSVVVLKLILQALAMGWNPDTDSMTTELPADSPGVGQPLPSVCQYTGSNLSETWEGREGRLFAYELIFKYLIKNHWLYTFGPAGSAMHLDSQINSREAAESPSDSDTSEYPTPEPGNNTRLPHVESDKSLAKDSRRSWRQVRFLSQAELHDNSSSHVQELHPKRRLNRFRDDCYSPVSSGSKESIEKMMTTYQDPDRHDPYTTHVSSSEQSPHTSGVNQGLQNEDNCSLLTQAQLVEYGIHGDMAESERSRVKQQKQLNKLQQIVEDTVNGGGCVWMEREYLWDMTRILKVMLYQTAESLGHSQWELRRIANQVLPCLAEVIRWYDINLLVSMWNSYLNVAMPTCLMTFTSVLMLKESVIHASRLVPLLHKPPHSWKDHERCRDCLSAITNTIQRRLPSYLSHLQHLVHRTSCDRLSVLAADVILLAYSHFVIISDQKLPHYMAVLHLWKRIFYFAHPTVRISTELLHSSCRGVFVSPFEGYLSCCLVKPDNRLQCAKQIEKLFIGDIHHRLSLYLEALPVLDVVSVAPILAHYTGLFMEDSHICKAVLESLQSHVSDIVHFTKDQHDREVKHLCLVYILVTLKELAAVVAMKSTDLPQVQKVLCMYETLCQPVNLNRHLAIVLSGISARLSETVQFTVDFPAASGSDSDDLYLLSNDIPLSNSPELQDDSDSEEVIVGTPSSARYMESLTLNTSNNSGSFTGRLSALSSHSGDAGGSHDTARESEGEEESEGSDWDSWDEEEESQSAFSEVFSQFLGNLQKSSPSEFMSEVKKLGEREKSVILGLLK